MNKTNVGLTEHCEKALKEDWHYLWGSFGAIATQSLLDSNIKQYPENAKWRTYAKKVIGKTRFCDCYGLVKSYLWWTDDSSNPKYNPAQDVNTSTAYSKATQKGTLSTLPEIAGVILYMQGHVGVYIGNGRFIECAGGGLGMIEGKIENGKVVKGSKFTHWFKDVNIDYIEKNQEIKMRYNTINEVPDYAKETIKKLIDKGFLSGNEVGLDLSLDMIRVFVINDKVGLYGV